jgi:hypothetical protein
VVNVISPERAVDEGERVVMLANLRDGCHFISETLRRKS